MQVKYVKLILIMVFQLMCCCSVVADDGSNPEIEVVHYAYANYLGSGIYRTTGQDASIINLPFAYDIDTVGKTTYGLRLPLSLGFFDFEIADIPELDLPSEVGTATFTPGVALSYQYSDNLAIETYLDYGYAKNFTSGYNVSIHSAGISSLYHFDYQELDAVWATRIYYAAYQGNGYSAQDSYAALQVGLDAGLPLKYQIFSYPFQPRLFATAFWYFNDVEFNSQKSIHNSEVSNVTLSNSVEFGLTFKFDRVIGYFWAGFDRLGLSYRFSDDFSAFRLLFSFPI